MYVLCPNLDIFIQHCLRKVEPLTEDLLDGGGEEEGGGDQGGGQHQEGHGAAGDQSPGPAPLLLPSPPVTQCFAMMLSLVFYFFCPLPSSTGGSGCRVAEAGRSNYQNCILMSRFIYYVTIINFHSF